MQPVGFVDDDPDKQGKWIHEVPVVGSCGELAALVTRLQADTVIVAMPTAPGSVIRDILQACERIGVSVMTVPGIAELISGKVAYSQIRPVQLEDLLRREPANLDLESIAGYIEGATVMVTGAGGHRLGRCAGRYWTTTQLACFSLDEERTASTISTRSCE